MMKAKKQNDKRGLKSEKLRLNKETLKELGAGKTEEVKGGYPTAGPVRCTQYWSGCAN